MQATAHEASITKFGQIRGQERGEIKVKKNALGGTIRRQLKMRHKIMGGSRIMIRRGVAVMAVMAQEAGLHDLEV